MKLTIWLIITAAAALFIVSCGEKEETAPAGDKSDEIIPQPGVSIEQRMQDFNKIISRQLGDFKAKTEQLREKIDQVALDRQAEFNKAIDAFVRHQEHAAKKLRQLEKATRDNWDKLMPEVGRAMTEVKKAYRTAESFLDKARPPSPE